MIIVRITMNIFLDKRTEVMQTLLSMIEPTENVRGCPSCHVFLDIEDKCVFSLIEEWETREDLDDRIKSDRFSVLLGTKSLFCEPPQIQIYMVSHSEGMKSVNTARGKESNCLVLYENAPMKKILKFCGRCSRQNESILQEA